MQQILSLYKSGKLAETQQFNAAMEYMCSESLWIQAFALLVAMRQNKALGGLVLDESTFGAVVRVCMSGQKWQLVLQLLSETQGNLPTPNSFIYSIVVRALLRAQQPQWLHAIGLLTEMTEHRVVPARFFFLDAWAALKNVPAGCALDFLTQIQQFSIEVGEPIVCSTICSLSREKQWQQAIQVWTGLQHGGAIPSVFLHTATLSAFEKLCRWQGALALFEQRHGLDTHCEIAYNVAVASCWKAKSWKEMLLLCTDMQKDTLHRDVAIWNSVARAWDENGHLDKAFDCVEEARSQGVQDVDDIILRGASFKAYMDAKQALHSTSTGASVDVAAIHEVINNCQRARLSVQAKHLSGLLSKAVRRSIF